MVCTQSGTRFLWIRSFFIALVLCAWQQEVHAQRHFVQKPERQESSYYEFEKAAFTTQQTETDASSWFDVTSYGLILDLTVDPNFLKGDVTISGICRQDNSQLLVLDLMNTMHVDSVRVNGESASFLQQTSTV